MNVDLVGESSHPLVFGIYRNGTVWCDLRALGEKRSTTMAETLAEGGLELPLTRNGNAKAFSFLRLGSATATVDQVEPEALVRGLLAIR